MSLTITQKTSGYVQFHIHWVSDQTNEKKNDAKLADRCVYECDFEVRAYPKSGPRDDLLFLFVPNRNLRQFSVRMRVFTTRSRFLRKILLIFHKWIILVRWKGITKPFSCYTNQLLNSLMYGSLAFL